MFDQSARQVPPLNDFGRTASHFCISKPGTLKSNFSLDGLSATFEALGTLVYHGISSSLASSIVVAAEIFLHDRTSDEPSFTIWAELLLITYQNSAMLAVHAHTSLADIPVL